MADDQETWSPGSVECPHCHHETTDDLYEIEEGDWEEFECPKCERTFQTSLHISYSYTSRPMPEQESE